MSNILQQTVTLGDAVLNLRYVEHVTGTDANDIIHGLTVGSPSTISAGAGNDTVYLGAGPHAVSGGAGEDTLVLTTTVTARVDGVAALITSAGSSFIYAEFERVQGGSGNDRMFGGSSGHYFAGSGTNYLEGSGNAILESTTGDTYFSLTGGGTIISGSGNDYMEVSGSQAVTIKFSVGSGHDMLGSYFDLHEEWAHDRKADLIIFDGLSSSDIELVWNFTETPLTMPGSFVRSGEAAIRISATGETLYLGTLQLVDLGPSWNGEYEYDWRFIELEEGFQSDAVVTYLNWDNASDDDFTSVELDIFSFDGVTRFNLFDFFDLWSTTSQPLPTEAKAAEDNLDQVAAGAGGAVVNGTDGSDNLGGSIGDDDLFGGSGSDTVNGGGGADFVRGGAGDDRLEGGPGNDNLQGGAGSDAFIYSSASHGGDIILDFMVSGSDFIDLSQLDADPSTSANDALAWGGTTATAHGAWFSQADGNTSLYADTDGNPATAEFSVVLQGFTGFGPFSDPLAPPPETMLLI